MTRLREFLTLSRIYLQCNGPIRSLRMAWVVSGG